MAELATERWVDLVMADQAVRHLREIGFGGSARFLHAAVTGRAGVGAVQMAPDVAWRRQIRFRIDRAADNRGDIAEREMLLVIEAREYRGPRRVDGCVLVAARADPDRRQVVVVEG